MNNKLAKSRLDRNGVNPKIKHQITSGFSLIELLIVIAIIGIIAGVAVPGYQQFILKERRADARHLLLSNAASLTKCFTLAGSYENNCRLLQTSKEGFYRLESVLTTTTWTNTAVPVTGKAQANDKDCQSITLNHIGIKSATGDRQDNCWH